MGTRGCAGHGAEAGAGSWLLTARGLHRNPRPGPKHGEAAGSCLPSQANSDINVVEWPAAIQTGDVEHLDISPVR